MKVNSFVKAGLLWLGFSILLSGFGFAQTATAPANGDGSFSNPYEIASLENLYWLSQNNTEWDKDYIQTADIDASETVNWDNGAGFSPIGTYSDRFAGSYNGDGYRIENLYINRPETRDVGFIGVTGRRFQEIKNIHLINADFTGYVNAGGIVGQNYSQIERCSFEGTIDGYLYIGGITGNNSYEISECYANASISGTKYVGGITGQTSSLIEDSYCRGQVSADDICGGLIGQYYSGDLYRNYSLVEVTNGGGVAGTYRNSSKDIHGVFWDVDASGVSTSALGIGLSGSEMRQLSYFLSTGYDFIGEDNNGTAEKWGINANENDGYPFLGWQNYNAEPIPCQEPVYSVELVDFFGIDSARFTLTSYEPNGSDGYVIFMNTENSFEDPTDGNIPGTNTVWQNSGQQCIYAGNSFAPDIEVANLDFNTTYYVRIYGYMECNGSIMYHGHSKDTLVATDPKTIKPSGLGTVEAPYQISKIENLAWVMLNYESWDEHYIQTNDIDASETADWYAGKGFQPIGHNYGPTTFSGSYNGKGYAIINLTIDRPDLYQAGVFGYTSGARIDSLHMEAVNITAKSVIGGIAGNTSRSQVNNCSVNGVLRGEESTVGGLVGTFYKSVMYSSSSTVSLYGTSYVGGLIGRAQASNVYSSYSEGEVFSSMRYGGGLIGYGADTVMNCYSHVDVSGNENVGGLKGQNGGYIANCYSTGTVDGNHSFGGFLGENYGNIENSYWDIDSSNISFSDGGTGLTNAEMKNIDNYLNWDFAYSEDDGSENIWGRNDAVNEGYPFFERHWQGLILSSDELPLIEAECSANLKVPTATDICNNFVYATTDDPLVYEEQGSFVVTWKFDDGNGNTVTQTQDVIIDDITSPEITSLNDLQKEIEAGETVYTVSGNELDISEYSDNCEVLNIVNDFNDGETLADAELSEGTTTITWTVSDAAGNTNECSYDVTVTIAETTSDEEIEPVDEVTVYPNPVKNTVNIAIEGQVIDKIEVLDMAGKVILEKKVKQYQTEFDMSVATAGVYFVHIYTSKKIITRKLLKN